MWSCNACTCSFHHLRLWTNTPNWNTPLSKTFTNRRRLRRDSGIQNWRGPRIAVGHQLWSSGWLDSGHTTLMVQKSGEKTRWYGSFSHYLRRFLSYMSGGWEWDFFHNSTFLFADLFPGFLKGGTSLFQREKYFQTSIHPSNNLYWGPPYSPYRKKSIKINEFHHFFSKMAWFFSHFLRVISLGCLFHHPCGPF